MSRYKDPILCVIALSAVLVGGYQFVYKSIIASLDKMVSDSVDGALKEIWNPKSRECNFDPVTNTALCPETAPTSTSVSPSPLSTPTVTEGVIPVETAEGFSF